MAEAEETFRASIAAPTGESGVSGSVTLGATTHADVTINANAAVAHFVSVSGPDSAVTEGGDAVFTFSLPAIAGSNARTAPLTVAYTLGGSAGGGASTLATRDYTTPTTLSVTFPASGAGSTSQTVTINTNDDALNEAAETITVQLGAITNAASFNSVGGAGVSSMPGTATIAANDPVTYSIADATAVNELDSGGAAVNLEFTVTLTAASAGDVTIPFTLAGSATGGGTDYTDPNPLTVTVSAGDTEADIEIAIVHDNLNEGTETVEVTLGATPTLGSGAGGVTRDTDAGDQSGSGSINDDDGITVALSGGGSVAEGDDAEVTVTISGATTTTATTVAYTIGATTVGTDNDAESADYTDTSGGSITINAGVTSGTITIAADADTLNEGDETFTVTVAASGITAAGAVATVTDGTQTFTITDDANDAITVTIARHSTAASVNEDATATFRVTLSGGTRTADVVMPFSFSGLDDAEYNITAPSGIMESATGGALTYTVATAATVTHMDITVDLIDDDTNEASETLTVTGAASGTATTNLRTAGAIGYASGDNTESVTVTDDDAITVTLARSTPAGTGYVAEG